MLRNKRSILFVLAAFCALSMATRPHPGHDLSSSYFGCRLLASGQGATLYDHDPVHFLLVGDPLWKILDRFHQFPSQQSVHPYVQTPLWAYILQPVCGHTTFRTFNTLFTVLTLLCFAGFIWLIARFWAPQLFHPAWIALVCVLLYVSDAFRDSVFLTQTHILFVLLSVVALILAPRDHPFWAGFLLACAAVVKITPGFLLLYWLVTRQTKAALSFIFFVAVLMLGTRLAVGPDIMSAYMHEVNFVSNLLLVSFNNQSFAALWMAPHFPASEIPLHTIYSLPAVVKVVSLALCAATSIVGGLLDHASDRTSHAVSSGPGYGAAFALIGATMFSPIAWSHYYFLLVLPLMFLLDAYRRDRSWLWLLFAAVLAVLSLNLYTLLLKLHSHSTLLVRGDFFAGALALLALLLLRLRSNSHPALPHSELPPLHAT